MASRLLSVLHQGTLTPRLVQTLLGSARNRIWYGKEGEMPYELKGPHNVRYPITDGPYLAVPITHCI